MQRLYLILGVAVGLFVVGGVAFLAAWDIPPPTSRVEQVLPNDRFPK